MMCKNKLLARYRSRNSHRFAAFTLMEVMIAIVILAASTITLLGVQAAVTRRASVDNQRIRAILAAREILAAAEVNVDPPTPGTITGTPEKVRDELLGKVAGLDKGPSPDSRELPLNANLNITEWSLPIPIPDVDGPLLYRYELTVSWGPGQGQAITINYFVPI